MDNIFWSNDLLILYKYYYIFVPHKDFTLIQNLNATVRFSIFLTIFYSIYKNSLNCLLLIPIVLFITYIIYKNNKKEFFSNYQENIINPTINNPLMNPSYSDYGNNKPLPIANPNITNKTIDEYLIKDIYYNPGDTSSKHLLQRNYYTIPSNDKQGELAKKLWDFPSCKKGDTEYCYMSLSPAHGSTFTRK
jgi:hypothetical protein